MTHNDFLVLAQKINNNMYVNKVILIRMLNSDLNWLYLNLNQNVHGIKLKQYLKKVQKYVDGCPLGQILGHVIFLNCKFKVNKHVLTPRSETEQLVVRINQLVKDLFRKTSKLQVLDLGTGSGCIAISLSKANLSWAVSGVDISRKALKTARKNSKLNEVNNCQFFKSNWFNKINNKFDLIIANPPYIDKDSASYNVIHLKNEPKLALFSENNGLISYQIILKQVNQFLNKDFLIAFEIGFDQKKPLTKIIDKSEMHKFRYWFEKDYHGKWRYLFISSKNFTTNS